MGGLVNIPLSFRLSSASLAVGRAKGKLSGAEYEVSRAIDEIKTILESYESDELESIKYQLDNLTYELKSIVEELESIRESIKGLGR